MQTQLTRTSNQIYSRKLPHIETYYWNRWEACMLVLKSLQEDLAENKRIIG